MLDRLGRADPVAGVPTSEAVLRPLPTMGGSMFCLLAFKRAIARDDLDSAWQRLAEIVGLRAGAPRSASEA